MVEFGVTSRVYYINGVRFRDVSNETCFTPIYNAHEARQVAYHGHVYEMRGSLPSKNKKADEPQP